MKKILAFPVLSVVVIGIIGLIIIWILHRVNKKNKKWSKKAANWYFLATWIIFALIGLMAILTNGGVYEIFIPFQAIVFALGILHAYLLFEVFRWPDEESFWTELFFTIALGCIAVLGLVPAYWAVDRWWGQAVGGSSDLIPAFVWIIIPHLIHRTIHNWEAIPARLYKAWRFKAASSAPLSFQNTTNIPVQIKLKDKWDSASSEWVITKAKVPENTALEHFFYQFVMDYNRKYPDQPIEDLTHTTRQQSLGWVFEWRDGKSKATLDPFEGIPHAQTASSWIVARRVLWAEDLNKGDGNVVLRPSGRATSEDSDGISIIPLN